ncbi:hypothetical protein Pmar_PMAR003770 [Perkinsus marinus ATCC 50983]|uniref:N-acetyltransferase domain-containing protein n=1 Tax=Perkinsus marinus (strain ATCC 50983 / TXsc) TaxID=423536 RepID=C5KEB5_PERM5|nr:hypothetical protein Pmar_PMAR003770 [Perkinsus marinus ATCC 50983]EER17173.1 hypothetical protein Pmar_PMAR003770 [Perkinsus marinus ATCC 50983]|eukprot:XP_002785377.1 hypothetical protein Pmar_PMAR003770 [Perkinsus marinus ATCC 50983]
MPGENFKRCQSHLCYVAVDVATSKNTVIGIIRTVIPDKDIDEDLDHLIREKIPKADKKGEIGHVELVEVLEDWRRKGVATALINHTFKYIGMKMPKVVAMYLIVNPLSKGAVELYKKTKFQFIIKDGICDIYARYDFT